MLSCSTAFNQHGAKCSETQNVGFSISAASTLGREEHLRDCLNVPRLTGRHMVVVALSCCSCTVKHVRLSLWPRRFGPHALHAVRKCSKADDGGTQRHTRSQQSLTSDGSRHVESSRQETQRNLEAIRFTRKQCLDPLRKHRAFVSMLPSSDAPWVCALRRHRVAPLAIPPRIAC